MQQLLAPSVFLTRAPNVQSLSLNARNFFISEPVLLLLFILFSNKVKCRVQNIAFPSSQNKEPSVLEYSPLILEHKLDIGGTLGGHSTVS